MSFATKVLRVTADHVVLVEIDIGFDNEQWVNHGAGIWVVQ